MTTAVVLGGILTCHVLLGAIVSRRILASGRWSGGRKSFALCAAWLLIVIGPLIMLFELSGDSKGAGNFVDPHSAGTLDRSNVDGSD